LKAELAGNGKIMAVDHAALSTNILVCTSIDGKILKAINLPAAQTTSIISDKVFYAIRQDADSTIYVQTVKGFMQLDKEALKAGKMANYFVNKAIQIHMLIQIHVWPPF
jgi:hypothetical protein